MENVYVNKFNKELELFSEKVKNFNCNFNLSEHNDVANSLRELDLEYQQICRDAETLVRLGFNINHKEIQKEIIALDINVKNNHINLLKDLYDETVSSMETREDADKALRIKDRLDKADIDLEKVTAWF